MAEIQLPQVHQALQALDLGQPVALQGESERVRPGASGSRAADTGLLTTGHRPQQLQGPGPEGPDQGPASAVLGQARAHGQKL